MAVGRSLGRAEVESLLTEVGSVLEAEGLRADLYVVGGAAMALAYDSRRLTRDVDAVFVPKTRVYEVAERVARAHPELGLADDWLNDAVKGLLPPVEDEGARAVLDAPGVSVLVASPEHLLAMKVSAARGAGSDGDDILTLAGVLGLRSIEEVLDVAERVFEGSGRLTARSEFFVRELLEGHLPASVDLALPPVASRVARDSLGSGTRRGTCGVHMPRADAPCGLPPGHRLPHRRR